ncbi:MAG: sigma-70 family RNA polymerase sigma factor [Gaiellaceae bacterium]
MTDSRLAELEGLYRRRFRVFLRVATAILRSDDRALDAVQEGFAAAIRERKRFRGEGPLEAWVWRLVVNAALKESVRPIHAELADIEAAGSSEDPTTVAEAVARLPERQRLTLFLRYYADLDYQSIAAALEVAPGTVAATLNAAHRTLRRLLQEVRP